mmetsp:Transcript_58544/g.164181  ORF Transcript_58544/g.164181 Transcript_58544/m.164181 type:complete len:240 (+) Transcript_58544:41-760(+)
MSISKWAAKAPGAAGFPDPSDCDADDASQEFTVMLRGIACKLGQEDVKTILDAVGLRGKFSSVYVPCVAVRRSNLGYGFVRFRTAAYARECYDLCHGRPLGPSSPGKVCGVVPARRQDKEAIDAKRRRRSDGSVGALVCDDPIELFVRRISEFAAIGSPNRLPPTPSSTGQPSSASSSASSSSWPSSCEGDSEFHTWRERAGAPFHAKSFVSSASEIFEGDEVETLFESSAPQPCSRAW